MEIYFNLFYQLKLTKFKYKIENLNVFGFFCEYFLIDVIRQNTTICFVSILALKGGYLWIMK